MLCSIASGSSSARAAEYVDFLNSVTPDNQDEYLLQMRRFNLGPVGEADCPVFDGMFDYCAVCRTWPKGTLICPSLVTSAAMQGTPAEVLLSKLRASRL